MSKIKKIIFILIIAVIAIFVYCNKAKAAMPSLSVGSTITIGMNWTSPNQYKLTNTSWLYCIQHPGGSLTSNKKNKYKVKYKVVIKGTSATCGSKSNSNKYNAILAYILAKSGYSYGYGSSSSSQTTRQLALWYYWNTWLSNSGSSLGITYSSWKNSYTGKSTSINNAATSWYSSNTSSNVTVSGKSSISYIEHGDANSGYGYLSYAATFNKGAHISKIVIYGTTGGTATITGTGNSGSLKIYSDSACTSPIAMEEIESGQTFYIYEKSSNWDIESFVVYVTGGSYTTYNATLYLMNSNTGSQRLIAVSYSTGTSTPTASKKVTVKKVTESTGNLGLMKYYRYYGSGSSSFSNATETGATFIIENSDGKYVRFLADSNGASDYTIAYTESKDNASKITTNSRYTTTATAAYSDWNDGNPYTIDLTRNGANNGIIVGLSCNYTYSIIQIDGPSYYNNPYYITSAQIYYPYINADSTWYELNGYTDYVASLTKTNTANDTVSNVYIFPNATTYLRMFNVPTSGLLQITKYGKIMEDTSQDISSNTDNSSDSEEDDSSGYQTVTATIYEDDDGYCYANLEDGYGSTYSMYFITNECGISER